MSMRMPKADKEEGERREEKRGLTSRDLESWLKGAKTWIVTETKGVMRPAERCQKCWRFIPEHEDQDVSNCSQIPLTKEEYGRELLTERNDIREIIKYLNDGKNRKNPLEESQDREKLQTQRADEAERRIEEMRAQIEELRKQSEEYFLENQALRGGGVVALEELGATAAEFSASNVAAADNVEYEETFEGDENRRSSWTRDYRETSPKMPSSQQSAVKNADSSKSTRKRHPNRQVDRQQNQQLQQHQPENLQKSTIATNSTNP